MKIYLNTMVNGRCVDNSQVATFNQEFAEEAEAAFSALCAKYEAICQKWYVEAEDEKYSIRQYDIEHITIEVLLQKFS